MLIPDVECWFPGDLPLDLVHEVLTVRVTDRRPKKGPAELLAEFYESERGKEHAPG
jgi:hypothetical protein